MFRQSSLSKIIILSGILLLSISPVFADEACTGTNSQQFEYFIKVLLSSLSRLWIPLASFAGKLMGNGFIYGEFFNLDKIFYLLRNFSRTFANYLVGGLILYKFVELLLSKGEFNGNEMTKYVLKMGGGILLANTSWFLIGATIDISTILTTTISGLSSTFVSQDTTSRDRMLGAIKNTRGQYNKKINLSTKCGDGQKLIEDGTKKSSDESVEKDEAILDKIMPNEDSITGPLLYIGIGVLQVQDFMYDAKQPGDITKDIFIIATRLAIVLMFVIVIIILIVINIFRIVTIRFAVSFAPLLIISVISGGDEKRKEIDILKNFSLTNILIAIFAPVVAVGLMNIGLIVIVIMQGFLQTTDSVEIDNISINNTTQGSVMKVDGIMETVIHGDILGQNGGSQIKNTFTNILLIVFTLFILYGIVKALMKFMEGTIGGESIKKMGELSRNLLTSMQVGGISIDNAKSMYNTTKDRISEKLAEKGINLTGYNNQDTILQNNLNKMFDLPTTMDRSTYTPLIKYTNKLLKNTSSITPNEIDNFTTYYEPIKAHYNQSPEYKKVSLSQMQGISSALPEYIQKVIQSQSNFKNKYGSSLNLGQRNKSDGTEHTIESYIQENYNQNNKKFFDDLYNKLGGDASQLKRDGSNFRNQPFRRAGDPNTPPPTP